MIIRLIPIKETEKEKFIKDLQSAFEVAVIKEYDREQYQGTYYIQQGIEEDCYRKESGCNVQQNKAGLRIANIRNQVASEIFHELLRSGFCFFANDRNKIGHAGHKKTEHHIEHIANVQTVIFEHANDENHGDENVCHQTS